MGKNTVILFGTRHLSGAEFPEYHAGLRSILMEIGPDIICAELSPEQLEGHVTCDSKPEQRDVIIPLARKLSIPIVPIQPPTKEGLAREKVKTAIINEIMNNSKSRVIWECIDKYTHYLSDLWRERMNNPECIENLQLQEFHTISEALDRTLKHFLPGLYDFYMSGNEYFLRKIEHAIECNSGRLILVVIGMAHKYWLWNRLIKIENAEIHDMCSYRQMREIKSSGSD